MNTEKRMVWTESTEYPTVPYYLESEIGERFQVTGNETILTTCPTCGSEHSLDFTFFVKEVLKKKKGLKKIKVHCPDCSEKEWVNLGLDRQLEALENEVKSLEAQFVN